MIGYVRYDQTSLNWSWQGFLLIVLLNLFVVALAFQYQAITKETIQEKILEKAKKEEREKKLRSLFPEKH